MLIRNIFVHAILYKKKILMQQFPVYLTALIMGPQVTEGKYACSLMLTTRFSNISMYHIFYFQQIAAAAKLP